MFNLAFKIFTRAFATLFPTTTLPRVGFRFHLHALLTSVGQWTGLAALINTSFNTKGKPIINSAAECLEMLDTLADLDYVLIEDWLFRKPDGPEEVRHVGAPPRPAASS